MSLIEEIEPSATDNSPQEIDGLQPTEAELEELIADLLSDDVAEEDDLDD